MGEFIKGQQLKLSYGKNAIIVEKLADGGQGVVYKAKYGGKYYALKWYHPNKLKDPIKFCDNLKANIIKGAPSKHFLWPLFVAENQFGSFGYLMNIRPAEYKDFGLFLTANAFFKSDITVINAALNLVNGFKELHSKGYSYQDLNDGNFFVNPDTGDVLICDNDNVAPYGENLGIAGKCRYMAPEVVLGEHLPDVHTDRFSLAVVLFFHLFRAHPLEGARTVSSPCMTDELEKKYFGSEPIFCWDSKNADNRPVRGIHNNAIKLWPLYPQYIQDAFEKSFTVCIKNREERITEREWQKIFLRLRNETITCQCGCENFMSILDDENAQEIRCSDCGMIIKKPLVLVVKKHKIALCPQMKLYDCHTSEDSDECTQVTGEVIRNKANPHLWGIKNTSDSTWIISTPDGKTKAVEKDQVVAIMRGIKICFGSHCGLIE